MTRAEWAIHINKQRAKKKRDIVFEFLNENRNNKNLKKKNGEWSILAVTKKIGLARNTVAKYIKEYEKLKTPPLLPKEEE